MGVLGGLAVLDRLHRDVFQIFRPNLDLQDELERWRHEEPDSLRENFDEQDLYPDVRQCFSDLRAAGIKVLIAGNQPVQARPALEAMGLAVDAILISAEIGVEKPAPAFFERVAGEAGVSPDEILFVGDRLDNDVLPARASGMRTVLLKRGPWGYLHAERPEAAAADFVTDSLADIPGIVARLQ